MSAGYSHRTVFEKLGIQSNSTIVLINPPDDYDTLCELKQHNVKTKNDPVETEQFIHLFVTQEQALALLIDKLKNALAPNGMLWISWPKGSSAMVTDLNENKIRELALAHGLVDVKVIAFDEIWSGLKLVFRIKDRK